MEDSGQNQLASMAVGIILVLLAASVAFMIYRAGHGLATNATTKVTELGNTLDSATITQYDGETITGSQLVTWLTQVYGQDVRVTIDVGDLVDVGQGECADYDMLTEDRQSFSDMMAGFKNKSDRDGYINPKALYNCVVTYSGSIPTSVTFTGTLG